MDDDDVSDGQDQLALPAGAGAPAGDRQSLRSQSAMDTHSGHRDGVASMRVFL